MRTDASIPRILVTGSRGKSSLVRLLHRAMVACGINAYARITGVEPRQLCPGGTRVISRRSGAHVGEMKWWLNQVPKDAGAVILENSAISPELQPLAAGWLRPTLIVVTNTYPDHQEVWGPELWHAARALIKGIPEKCRVVIPEDITPYLFSVFDQLGCSLIVAPATKGQSHEVSNRSLAMAAVEELGLDISVCRRTMATLKGDTHDFSVQAFNGASLALAFTVNDISSTRKIFRSLGWEPRNTRILYNHRYDRPGRLSSFFNWMTTTDWQRVDIIGDKPAHRIPRTRYTRVTRAEDLLAMIRPGERIFGCGNVAGIPLTLPSLIRSCA